MQAVPTAMYLSMEFSPAVESAGRIQAGAGGAGRGESGQGADEFWRKNEIRPGLRAPA
jgi:hypothetical protein